MSSNAGPGRQAGRSPQDIIGGLLLVAIAGLALYMVNHLPAFGRVGFASGTAPRLFAYGLGGLGAFIAIKGFTAEGQALEPWYFRAPVAIIGAIVLFSVLIREVGLAITGVLCVVLAAAATDEVRWKEAIIFAVGMTAFCALLFSVALGQPIPLWPRQ